MRTTGITAVCNSAAVLATVAVGGGNIGVRFYRVPTIKMMNKKLTVKGSTLLLVALAGLFQLGFAQAADPRNGAKIYNNHCANCHGAQGNGMMPGMPNFLRGEGLLKPDAALVQTLENGAGMMPAFRGLLTTQEMLDVIAYLRTMH